MSLDRNSSIEITDTNTSTFHHLVEGLNSNLAPFDVG